MGIWSKIAGPGADLEAHDVVTRAVHFAGTSDFGSNAWSTPLEVLTRSITTDANLHREGRRAAREFLVKLLAGRAATPDSEATTPNSDPTAGQGADPSNILIVLGIDGSGAHHLARALRSERKRRDLDEPNVSPRTETRLFLQEFTSFEFERRWHVPAYAEWLAETDLVDAYASAGSRLAGDGRTAGMLVLQGEHHLEHLGLLDQHFPGATIVHVHRDPLECLKESTDRLVTARQAESDSVDADKVAKYWKWRSGLLLERYVDQRRTLVPGGGAGPILDLDHQAVALDYAGVAAALMDLDGGQGGDESAAGLAPYLLGAPSLPTDDSTSDQPSEGDGFEMYREWLAASFA